jgi:Rad51
LLQNTLVKTTSSPELLSLNMRNVNKLFPGFQAGDFALIYGSNAIQIIATLLSIRAQLPTQLGGLASNVIFIDGANSFRLYQTTRLARLCNLDPNQVLDHIYISRAFTAYQVSALITSQLEEATKKYSAKLVIISDIAAYFLDEDITEEEAQRIFSQITNYLSNFAKEKQIIILATYLPHPQTKRNTLLHASNYSKANVVLALKKTSHARQFILEKHPTQSLGLSEVPFEDLTLDDFLEVSA